MEDNTLHYQLRSKTSVDEDNTLYAIPAKQDHSKSYTKLFIVSVMCLIFITGEIVGGILSHSISVISDATHLITDLIGFILSFVFLYYSSKHPDNEKSFGFHRLQIIGAIANLFIIWAVAFFLIIESTSRIINKEFVQEPTIMLIVAGGGLLVNIGMYFVLHSGTGHSHGLGQECTHSHSAPVIPDAIAEQPEFEIMQEELDTGLNKSAINQADKPLNDKVANVPSHQNCNHDPEHQHSHDHHDHSHEEAHKHEHDHPHPHPHLHDHSKPHEHKHQNSSNCHTHDHDHGLGHHSKSSHQHQSISMKAAVLHALTDIIQSIGLLTAAILIFFFGSDHGATVTQFNSWHYLDPITTYIFSFLVIYSTWPITKLCFNIILEATPQDIKPDEIKDDFRRCEGVRDIHDFHVWQLKPGKMVLTAHVSAERGKQIDVLRRLTKACRRKKIYHSTIQIEQWELQGKKGYIVCENDID